MKKDFNNIPPLDPGKSWQVAEKMLDRHFQLMRRKKRMTLLIIAGLSLLFSAYLADKYFMEPARQSAKNTPAMQTGGTENDIQNTVSVAKQQGNPEKEFQQKHNLSERNRTTPATEQPEKLYSGPVTTTKVQNATKKSSSLVSAENTSIINDEAVENKILENRKASQVPSENSIKINSTSAQDGKSFAEKSNVSETKILPSFAGNSTTPGSKIEPIHPVPNKPFVIASTEPILRSPENITLLADVKSKSKLNIGYSIYASLHSISKTLKASEGSEYLDRRKHEEKSILAPSLGAAVKLSRNNLSTSLGIEYAYWGEKTSYDAFSKQTQYTHNGAWQTYYRSVIDTDTAYVSGIQWLLKTPVNQLDSSYNTYTDTAVVNVYDPTISERNGTNQFYYIEVPLVVSYQFPVRRYGIGFSLGVSPAWMTSERGYYLKEDLSGVESIRETRPLKTFFLNGRISLDFSYQFNPRLNMVLSPQLKTNLASISNSSHATQQRYTAAGICFGLVYTVQ